MKYFTPVICFRSGFWGGNFHCLASSEAEAFRMLERRIPDGRIRWTPLGEAKKADQSMIDIEDQRTWPRKGSVWRHTNGNQYQVDDFTNIETSSQDKYPTTIVYRNIRNGAAYSRPLTDWERSMTQVTI